MKRYLSANLKDNPPDVPLELDGRITVEEAIALALIKKALSGDIAAIKEIQDTVHGKLTDASEIQHSYKQMGSIIMVAPDGHERELTFNVGEEPNKPRH